jgi:putative tricarboxylic transport membrane protein
MLCDGLGVNLGRVASAAVAVEIVAGTPPGGGQDRAARAIAGLLGYGVTVTNLPGRGGGNAWDRLFAASGDADLAAVSSPTLITNAIVGLSDIDHRNLTPLGLLYTEHSALVVRPGSGLEEPSAMLETIGRGSALISFATALGNMNHLILAEIATHLGVPVSNIPVRVFESAPQALADVITGSGHIAVASAASAVPSLAEGALVPVMVTSPNRLGRVFADTPTCLELGVPCVRGTWRGLVGPPGLEQSTVDVWADRLAGVTGTGSWGRLLEDNLWTGTYRGPEDTGKFLEAEREQLVLLLEELGLVATVGDG